MPDDGIRLSVKHLMREVEVFESIASDMFTATSGSVFSNLKTQISQLKGVQSAGRVEIGLGLPLETVPIALGSEVEVSARITTLFEVTAQGQPVKKAGIDRIVAITGIASTVAEFVDSDGATIASWRMEIASPQHPGSFFHIQIPDTRPGGPEIQTDVRWPAWLEVPRFPAVPLTPMVAAEFVLTELSPAWPENSNCDATSFGQWWNLQRNRLVKHLEWRCEALRSNAGTTPLLAMKDALPPATLLLP